MQIVIEIHEKDYRSALNGVLTYSAIYSFTHGTVLPKNHGRLIDADALKKKEVHSITEWNGDVHRIIYEASVDDAPTIIDAVKGADNEPTDT